MKPKSVDYLYKPQKPISLRIYCKDTLTKYEIIFYKMSEYQEN